MEQTVGRILRESGIECFGFCAFSRVQKYLIDCRAKSRLPENAQTVIMCAFPYRVHEGKPRNISRYAAVPDYHLICKNYVNQATEKLTAAFPENQFVWFQDNSPIPEVHTAASAGLGVVGDNGLLITPQYGSWVFLGEWVTDLKIDAPDRYATCPHCGACKIACPKTDTCLSAVTQKKGELTAEERTLLKENGLIWGCDICAEVCPLNAEKQIAPLPEFAADYRDGFSPEESIDGRAYAWRGNDPVLRNARNLAE